MKFGAWRPGYGSKFRCGCIGDSPRPKKMRFWSKNDENGSKPKIRKFRRSAAWPRPFNLPKTPNPSLIEQNTLLIENLLKNPKSKISKILCCWGNHVEDHFYLALQAQKILECIRGHGLHLYCIGKTKSGNPFHPAPMAVNRFLGGINHLKLIAYDWALEKILHLVVVSTNTQGIQQFIGILIWGLATDYFRDQFFLPFFLVQPDQ
mgnify:CR=1 FL=1